MQRQLMVHAAALFMPGCATIVMDSNQPVRVDTRTEGGEMVTGAECTLKNEYGTFTTKSGDASQVRRSSQDLDITCKHPTNTDAYGRAISRANAGLAGNILFGGGIGAIIDHSKGTAYTYPTWIQLVFGQTLVFDRHAEKEGAPVTGSPPVAQSNFLILDMRTTGNS